MTPVEARRSQPAETGTHPANLKLTWVHGLRGLATIIIILGHYRMCFWDWSTYDSTDGRVHLIQQPVIRLIWAGKPAVRLLMILSGIVLSNRAFSCLESGNSMKALRALLRAMQMRYLRLSIPLTMISVISVILLWLGAFEVSRSMPGYLNEGLPKSTGNPVHDLWLAIWGGFVDLYIRGWQFAHSSLWCMKAQLLGSYLLYGILLIQGGRPQYPWLMWIFGIAILISGQAAAARLTDAAGVLFGGVAAYHMRFINGKSPSSGAWNGVLIVAGLMLCSYPTLGPNTLWGSVMLSIGRIIMLLGPWDAPIEVGHQKSVAGLWHTAGACMIVFAVSQLSHRDKLFGHYVLQWAGTMSFALFVIHPLIFWSVGSWTFYFTRQLLYSFDVIDYADALARVAFLLTSLPLLVLLCTWWNAWVDVKMFKAIQAAIPEPGEKWMPSNAEAVSSLGVSRTMSAAPSIGNIV